MSLRPEIPSIIYLFIYLFIYLWIVWIRHSQEILEMLRKVKGSFKEESETKQQIWGVVPKRNFVIIARVWSHTMRRELCRIASSPLELGSSHSFDSICSAVQFQF